MKNEQLISRLVGAVALGLTMAVLVIGLFATGPDVLQGQYVRLLCVHPGVAWTAYVAFSITTVASLLWLWPRTRKPFFDQIAGASAEIGVVFTFLALLTGSIWARTTWSGWWVWDARTTSTALLLFMYLGVLAIRSVPATSAMRAQRSAFTALIAFVNVPLVHFSVKLWRTQHQGPSLLRAKPTVHGWQLVGLLLSFFAFTAIYFWLLIQRYRVTRWEDQISHGGLDSAIADRRAEGRLTGPVGPVGSVGGRS
jgi:heme exporter protein C